MTPVVWIWQLEQAESGFSQYPERYDAMAVLRLIDQQQIPDFIPPPFLSLTFPGPHTHLDSQRRDAAVEAAQNVGVGQAAQRACCVLPARVAVLLAVLGI